MEGRDGMFRGICPNLGERCITWWSLAFLAYGGVDLMGLIYLGDEFFREGTVSWSSMVGHLNIGARCCGISHRGLDISKGLSKNDSLV